MPRPKGTSQRNRGGKSCSSSQSKMSKNPAAMRSHHAAVDTHDASARGRSVVRESVPKSRSTRHSPCKKCKGSVGANWQPGLSDAPGAAKARKRMRSSRETAALDAENEKAEAIKAMNALPKDMGATAPSRHATFAREGRSDSATQQAAERASRTTGAKIQKLIRKKEYAQAAATLGGLVRNPQIRPLLAAAGIVLSEDTELDL